MITFGSLTTYQQNVLLASILGDGEITKLYKNSRRINRSYREHYSKEQEDYRMWKCAVLPELLYKRQKGNYIVSKSLEMFNYLSDHFYPENTDKRIPVQLLRYISHPIFIAVLYLDDGSLCISRRINHHKKKITLSPVIALYLQCFEEEELILLKKHIKEIFDYDLVLSKRKDGKGTILKLQKTAEVYQFLKLIGTEINLESMRYKFDWEYRFIKERQRYRSLYPDYEVTSAHSNNFRPYTANEIETMMALKQKGETDAKIAQTLDRSYWSVVYKLAELRKAKRRPPKKPS
ncbi:DNA endonuclease [Bacillus mangrovi]|uniref:DNA endonuclease n=1 Tax=Metabacillus mangrovi TaxID=1491830 RepID=A0A7X2V6C5_9BACI|nr:DNA endonuclease [Metabacillus mangrovi]MTH55064.1 DNA endonuclease [Metabacillus mangrovi]